MTESNAALQFTDDEIRAALKFMVMSPIITSQEELRTIIVSVIFKSEFHLNAMRMKIDLFVSIDGHVRGNE